jgi:3-hydroxyisobutyrate dehydrogenase-like beta-hydroxyacid dehydrogenase
MAAIDDQIRKRTTMTIMGFLGFGEASFNIAEGLREEGMTGIRAFDAAWQKEPHAALIKERAEKAGVLLEASAADLISNVDIVVCSISANMAIPVAEQSVSLLRPEQIYVDLNSAGPDTKVAVDKIISTRASFVDVAVMGTVPGNRHKVPMLAAGKGAVAFAEFMNRHGAQVTALEGEPGKASASKMFRSIFMKGYVMLLLEAVIAGRQFGLEDDVLASIRDTLMGGDFLTNVNDMMARAVIHAERREHEMDEVIATLESLGLDSTMSVASKNKLAWCVEQGFREHFKGKPPADYHEIFSALKA